MSDPDKATQDPSLTRDLYVLLRDEPTSAVARLALSPHRTQRGSAGEAWGHFLQRVLLIAGGWAVAWGVFLYGVGARWEALSWPLALGAMVAPWAVTWGLWRAGVFERRYVSTRSADERSRLEHQLAARIAPYLREDAQCVVYGSRKAPGLTAALRGETVLGGRLSARVDARLRAIRLYLKVTGRHVRPLMHELERIGLPSVELTHLTDAEGGVEVRLSGAPEDWWSCLPELRDGRVTRDVVAYVAGFVLSRLSLRSRAFERVAVELGARAGVEVTPAPRSPLDTLCAERAEVPWVARRIIPVEPEDPEASERHLDAGTSVYHQSGPLVALLAMMTALMVLALDATSGPMMVPALGVCVGGGLWMMRAWHEAMAHLPYSRSTPYARLDALEPRGSLHVEGERLSMGPGHDAIDLKRPFRLTMAREQTTASGALLVGVHLHQRDDEGGAARLSMSLHVAATPALEALEVYDSLAPLVDAPRFVRDVWPTLRYYCAVHGQEVPCDLIAPGSAERDDSAGALAYAAAPAQQVVTVGSASAASS